MNVIEAKELALKSELEVLQKDIIYACKQGHYKITRSYISPEAISHLQSLGYGVKEVKERVMFRVWKIYDIFW